MSKVVNFTCDECQTAGSVNFSDIEYEQEGSEGGMGGRVEYWGKFEGVCSNPECSNDITVEDNYTEYPVGNFESGDTTVSGASRV